MTETQSVHPLLVPLAVGRRRDALWRHADEVMATRALFRVGITLAWVLMAARFAEAATWRWGVLALAGSLLSLLHSQQPLVTRFVASHPGYLGRFMRVCLPYPNEPHVNVPGLLETAGLVSMGLVTGWPGEAFAKNASAALLETLLLFLFLCSWLLNLVAHVTWALEPGPAFFRWIRHVLSPCAALIAVGLLWFSSDAPENRAGVLIAAVLTVGVCWLGARTQDDLALVFDDTLRGAYLDAQDQLGRIVHSEVKNPSRIVMGGHMQITDRLLRQQVRGMCLRAADAVRQIWEGTAPRIQNASQVLSTMCSEIPQVSRFAQAVAEDIDPAELELYDALTVRTVLGDLVTNAVQVNASNVRISLTALPAPVGSCLQLCVTCWCDQPLDLSRASKTTSLGVTVRSLEQVDGRLTVEQHEDGSHSFVATWPTNNHPRPLEISHGSRKEA